MDSEAFVHLALDILQCNQKDLATRLGVSPTQISKWKKGEHLSSDMEEKFREILQIGEQDPRFILWSGSFENARKWERLINYLANVAEQSAETGYDTYPLLDEYGLLCWETFHVLREMGVVIPKDFPKDLDIDYDEAGNADDDGEEIFAVLERNPYSSLIYDIYKLLNDVYGFYCAYISKLMSDDELYLIDTPACNIEPCLMSLAACKLAEGHELASGFKKFRRQVEKEYTEWLTIVKDRAFRAGIPLGAELLDLVHHSADELGNDAEAESLGFNSSRLHPDIYMNELLVGMRVIHQVLPAIMKTLGIDEEFELDESGLRI
ncbi:XRE family transcriptional regulator [Undibacterium sp.]|uniref:XRE family transcriptional regulator n=1 Tax=Undibacterium sp. TaxID=1914977 RepID=UPI00374D8058